MLRTPRLTQLLSACALWLTACATADDGGGKPADGRDDALEILQRAAGAPVSLELNEHGVTRVIGMTPRFPVPGHAADPAQAAIDFLVAHHDAFQMTAAEAASFVVTRVDPEPSRNLSHVTLQRTFDGIPVFQGAITIHMDGGNGVFRVLGDEFYRIAAPTNRMALSPDEAALAAGRALGVALSPSPTPSEARGTVFTAPGMLEPVKVAPRIVQVAPDDSRFAYQVLVSWRDDQRHQQYQLALIDGETGATLARHSLVNTFTGRVFSASAQPTANMTTDRRTVVSFDGDPIASPRGWVGPARTTMGNNAIAITDLDGDNAPSSDEIQPTADANDRFDFPFDPTQDASGFREASVTNAFFYVNDWHDRTYALGFTETAGNFQADNLGKGGAQNDAVQVDAQDGLDTDNANFATPPDGSAPRMQMFLFTGTGGPREDGDLDASVVYHENTHGLSNRLVGGGSTGCLGGLQSGGMGEGWSDYVAASFLDNPVIGAYVTGNAATGARLYSMAHSPLGYGDIRTGDISEVHDVGELWAAVLWGARTALGAAITDQLVVSGMKLTPCSPTMLQARDGILQADANLYGGANRCKLWTAFAARGMGAGASSANHNSSITIATSSAVPVDCTGGVTRTFTATDLPRAIPDHSATGARSVIDVTEAGLDVQRVTVDVGIAHTFRGDLVIRVIAPNGQTATLSSRAGGSADDFVVSGRDITSAFTPGSAATGTWQLFVQDLARVDVGTINSFAVHLLSTH